MKNNNDLKIFKKGKFVPLDGAFITESVSALQKLSKVQKKYNKKDTDTIINEIRDGIIGKYLDYKLINIEKHGFDGKKVGSDEFLEVKQCSVSSSSWAATFNDTNKEKAEAFKDEKLLLALAVWDDVTDLLFICFGQNIEIGNYLEEKMNNRPEGSRSTQTISFSALINKYGFKIYIPNSKDVDDVCNIISLNNSRLKFRHSLKRIN